MMTMPYIIKVMGDIGEMDFKALHKTLENQLGKSLAMNTKETR